MITILILLSTLTYMVTYTVSRLTVCTSHNSFDLLGIAVISVIATNAVTLLIVSYLLRAYITTGYSVILYFVHRYAYLLENPWTYVYVCWFWDASIVASCDVSRSTWVQLDNVRKPSANQMPVTSSMVCRFCQTSMSCWNLGKTRKTLVVTRC